MTTAMNMGAFKDLLETYGADLARWPADTRAQAAITLETSETARNLYADFAPVDDAFADTKAPAGLAEKIIKKIQTS